MRTEHHEQAALCQWLSLRKIPYFAIPNGGARNAVTGAILKREGVQPGVPDLCVPVPCKQFHGLFIEMKTVKGRACDAQKAWISLLSEKGYAAHVCKGFGEAKKVVEEYFS